MQVQLDDLRVFFPFPSIYPEQLDMMAELKRALDAKGHAVLECPTGTGKTVALLSLITSYQFAKPETGKLIYCTRTVPEMTKCVEELKLVLKNRAEALGNKDPTQGGFLAVCLSSRRNMCIHPDIIQSKDRDGVDAACRRRIAPWVRAANGRVSQPNPSAADPARATTTTTTTTGGVSLGDAAHGLSRAEQQAMLEEDPD